MIIEFPSAAINTAVNATFERIWVSVGRAFDEMEVEIPRRIRSTFDVAGARGDNPPWKPVPLFWLQRRETFPFPDASTDSERAANIEYVRRATPLIDTGRLHASILVTERTIGETERGFKVTGLPYGAKQHFGVEGKIWARPHMELLGVDQEYINTQITEAIRRA